MTDDLLERSKRTNHDLPQPDLPDITTVDVDGLLVAHRDVPGPSADAPTFLLVHGLGGSLANWEPVVSAVARHGRVLTPDLAGFGRTDAPADRCGVADNTRLLARYCEIVGASRVIAVGNSMGGLISAQLAATHPDLVDRLVLVDPVLPLDPRTPVQPSVAAVFGLYAVSPVGRRVLPRYIAKVGLERLGIDGVRQVVADPDRVPAWVYERAVQEAIEHAKGEHAVAAMVRAGQSIVTTALRPRYRRLLGRLSMPVTLVHGDADELVPVTSARRVAAAHPRWRYVEARGVGHVPMYEVAEWIGALIVGEA